MLPHSSDLRKGRVSITGQVYLLTTSTANRAPVFDDFQAARFCISAMHYQQRLGRVESLAYVLMPDHLHWLVELQQGELAGVMKSVKAFSSRQVNKMFQRSGQLWQDGYHDRALRCDEDIMAVARYVVANPVRAGLVDRVFDYPHWDAVWVGED
jgi:REP element-mobilizing transposase RayT